MKKVFLISSVLSVILCSCQLARTVVYNDPGLQDFKFMPYSRVKAGNYQPIPEASSYNTMKLPDSLRRALTQTQTVAFLVLKHDSIVYEWYAPGYTDSSRTNPFSMTKSIMSILTGVALKEGKIQSIDDPIGKYYEPYKYGDLGKVTLHHVITMSSGLNYHDQYLNPFGHVATLYYGRDLRKFVNTMKYEKPAGYEFRYKNVDPEILGVALTQAVGMNMTQYASEKLWGPLGAAHDAYWLTDRKGGMEKTYCCFHSNARDFARIGMLYEHYGNWKGTQIVDSSYVRASLTPINLPDGERGDTVICKRYGYLWWLRNTDGKSDFRADGMKGQYVGVLPDKDIVFVRLGLRDWYSSGSRFKHGGPFLYGTIVKMLRQMF
ncbi:MAG: serine hydrolase [Bacteroidetes bacterium]|nr:serine hydrolase [Bacteroidota bacterium]